MSVISQSLIQICTEIIGATGKTFLERQCKYHLNVDLDRVEKNHLDELARWCEVSGGLIVGKDKALNFKQKVLALK